MNLLKRNLIYVMMIFVGVVLSAQKIDDARYKNVLQQLNLKSTQINEELLAEKKMPNLQNSFVIVIPVLVGKYEYDSFTVKNTILITDKNGFIKNKFSDPDEYYSDAFMLQDFTVDTGLYLLDSKTRAFSIIASQRNGSQPNPAGYENISFYVPQGKTLKKILSQYEIYSSGGEWDMKCAGEFSTTKSVIIVDGAKTNGFANLKVKTEHTETTAKQIDEECVEKKSSKISYKILKFNKSVYQ